MNKRHIGVAVLLTVLGLTYVCIGLYVQAELNWTLFYSNLMYLIGKTAALTVFSLVLLWGALLINHVVPGDWFAIQNDLAIAIVWASTLIALAFAWAWG